MSAPAAPAAPATARVAPADSTAGPDLGRVTSVAYDQGLAAGLLLLHAELGTRTLPAGPGGHVLLPPELVAGCDHVTTPEGPRQRDLRTGKDYGEAELGRVAAGPESAAGELVALRITGAGPGPDDHWGAGILAVRLGVADRLLRQAADHLHTRTVQGANTLGLPMVRGLVADAASGVAEVRALLATGPDQAAVRRSHRALDASGRTCLHLFGAAGFLTGGPGSTVRASELLADVYAPVHDQESP
ncbi:hypothetical protein [Streptomyces sp. NPDC051569]|uniref:hypothetical protein n=1 Tax=Streptomyces sp. NPDC051569 TaxID=3365661 RepID=UPI0037B23187